MNIYMYLYLKKYTNLCPGMLHRKYELNRTETDVFLTANLLHLIFDL